MGNNNEKFRCPFCDQGHLVPKQIEVEQGTYKSKTFEVEYEASFCSACGFDMVTPPQAVRNQARVRDAQRQSDGLLTSSEIKTIREQLNLSPTQADELFGEELHTFVKYEKGETMQSTSLDKLLRLVSSTPAAFEKLRQLAIKN